MNMYTYPDDSITLYVPTLYVQNAGRLLLLAITARISIVSGKQSAKLSLL